MNDEQVACPTGECDGFGVVWVETCTCDPGPEGQHRWHCGCVPCPSGCEFRPSVIIPDEGLGFGG